MEGFGVGFDKTLIPGYMQEPLFRRFNVADTQFWAEVNGLPDFYKKNGLELVSKDTFYLNHILTYVRTGIFAGLTNSLLRDLGSELEFYPGLPEFFPNVKEAISNNDDYRKHGIQVEHYIVSTGLRQMILGSKIAKHVDGVWACEFVETVPPAGYLEPLATLLIPPNSAIADIGYVIDNTTKIRAVFEINKGTNKVPEIDVNATIKHGDRRVPFQNMIYIADGPSDIPVYSVINLFGGKTYAVYGKGAKKEFSQVNNLQRQGRVQSFGEAEYSDGTQTSLWIMNSAEEIANRIVSDRVRALGDAVGKPPGHILD